MSRLRTCFGLLLVLLALLSRPSLAALIPRYELDSLCYMSTDIVEATLVRHHIAGQPVGKNTFTTTVLSTIAGHYREGDKIILYGLQNYAATQNPQHCLILITNKQFREDFHPQPAVNPQVVDMLLINSHGHVERYRQASNHAGLSTQRHR